MENFKRDFLDCSATLAGGTLTLECGGIRREYAEIAAAEPEITDNNGLSESFLRVTAETAAGRRVFELYPGLPLVYTCPHDKNDVYDLETRHLRVKTVRLADITDQNDALVLEDNRTVYHHTPLTLAGNIYIIEDYLRSRALVAVTDAPSYSPAKLTIKNGRVTFEGQNYGVAFGFCHPDDAPSLVKNYYRAVYRGERKRSTFVMSNTWGDRNGGTKLCHDFILREIDMAAKLGVDIVQIDDGWQKGDVRDAMIYEKGKFTGLMAFPDEFWELDEVKFPHGIKPLADYAAERGVTLGLWFDPDSRDEFTNRFRDLALIEKFWREYGVRYIKLDGVNITSDKAEQNYLEFLDGLSKIGGGALEFNLDITAGKRLGYMLGKKYGTIFVENRYTDWGNYFPHNTLRNLWQLSRYIPADKFQFELLNPRRNADKYGFDPLAPTLYDMDYLFASVMASNPLVWMEMQSLEPADAEKLAKIIAVYREHRAAMFDAPAVPIGAPPSGASICGLDFPLESGGYLLLFRELCAPSEGEITHTLHAEPDFKLLASNADVSLRYSDGVINAEFSRAGAYAFYKY